MCVHLAGVQVHTHLQYGAMFGLAAVAARTPGFASYFQSWRWATLAAALAAWALRVLVAVPAPWQAVAYRIQQWGALVAALGFAHRHLDADRPLLRHLTEAVFPLYIVHQTLIIVLAVALRPLALPPVPEGLLLVAATFAQGLLAWRTARRVPWLRRPMGLRPVGEAGSIRRPQATGSPRALVPRD